MSRARVPIAGAAGAFTRLVGQPPFPDPPAREHGTIRLRDMCTHRPSECPLAHWLHCASPCIIPTPLQTMEELGIEYEIKETSIKAGDKPAWFTELYQRSLGANEGR